MLCCELGHHLGTEVRHDDDHLRVRQGDFLDRAGTFVAHRFSFSWCACYQALRTLRLTDLARRRSALVVAGPMFRDLLNEFAAEGSPVVPCRILFGERQTATFD